MKLGIKDTYKNILAKMQAFKAMKPPPVIKVPLADIDFKLPKEFRQQFGTQYLFTNSENDHCYCVFDRQTGSQRNTLHLSGGKAVTISYPDQVYMQ